MTSQAKSRWRWTWAGYFAALSFCADVTPEAVVSWAALGLMFLTGIQFGWNIRCDVITAIEEESDGN